MKPGNAMPLAAMPVGTIVHNIEMKPGKGGQIARSAGTYAQYLGRDAGYALLRLNSGEVRKVPLTCMATVGAVSNPDHMNEVIGKAGRNVWKGKRPSRPRHRDEPDRPSRMAAAKAAPRAAVIRSRRGASRPRAPRRARTSAPPRFIVRSRHAKKRKGKTNDSLQFGKVRLSTVIC